MEAYQQLEQEFGKWINRENIVACSSGTAALHLALETLRMHPRNKIIVPNYTMVACPRAVVMAGLEPMFVDCDDSLLMDLDCVDKAGATIPGIVGIMPVHVYGRAVNMSELGDLASKYGWHIVEDMAEAHGVAPFEFSDCACWSFYKNKVIHGEEGGAVYFHDRYRAELARSLRCLGFTDRHDFDHLPRGHNYRLSNVHAQLILKSLKEADTAIALRNKAAYLYDQKCPTAWRMPPRNVVWVYDLRIPGMGQDKQDELVKELNKRGVMARHGFKPMTSQAEFRDCRVVTNGNAEKLASEIIYLGISKLESASQVEEEVDWAMSNLLELAS